MILSSVLSWLASALFPPLCVTCCALINTADSKYFCPDCRNRLVLLTGAICPICGTHFPDSPAESHLCGSCAESPPPFALARACVGYDGPVLDAIHQFKYGRRLDIGRALASFCASFDYPDIDWTKYDVVIPVPLHVRRLRHRGFNQSLILARALSRTHRLPVDFSLLKRRKPTLTQTGLNKKERDQNMKGAFEVTRPDRMQNLRVLLVDDVLTTGSTTRECARELIRSGASEVAVVALARVPAEH